MGVETKFETSKNVKSKAKLVRKESISHAKLNDKI